MYTSNGRLLVGVPLLALAALVWLVSGASSDGEGEEQGTLALVERRSFEVRVRAVGELEPVQSTMISSGVRGDRGKIIQLIEDGSEVVEGDLLARLDPTPFEEEIRKLELEVGQVESLVDAKRQLLEWERAQAERQVETAAFDLKVARLDLGRVEKGEGPLELARLEGDLGDAVQAAENQAGYVLELKALAEKGYVEPTEIEQAEKLVEKERREQELARRKFESYRDFILPALVASLEARVEHAGVELEQVRVSGGFKVGEAQASLNRSDRELESARVRLANARVELERTVIRAPIGGLVVHREEYRDGQKRKPRVGDVVWQNQPLMYLPDLTRMLVNTRVREVDLHKVEPGNRAVVRLDAYPDKVLQASVRSIGVLAERQQEQWAGDKHFRLVVMLEDADPKLRPGMTARVDILSRTVEDELTVPLNAIFQEQGRSYCYVDRLGRLERREVSVGPRNEHLAVVGGLEDGERVSLTRPEP